MLDASPLPLSSSDADAFFSPTAFGPVPAAADWRQTLKVGDIVSFRFPVEDVEGGPAKNRPCLVLEVEQTHAAPRITLAYGTTVPGGRKRGYEVRVSDPAAFREAGLHRPTRFIGLRRLTVSADHPAFAVCRDLGTPKIGRLTGAEFERLQAVRARIHAEADIAAERRAERRREVAEERARRSQAPARPFVVEIKRRRSAVAR
ncbi:hypothetical protein RSWS8N_12545 [Cereibacter sphaeroides WS8N]|uniref:hypothetical protein n=1 Tax=Cereibacter sphaeroides TaxID=1063 RepID=UPI00020DF36E|nr:hypothetical protein [Cereibacter sphaeroides]EGJ22917.1 hypothetical protein RSWS8N_12545 [Cereibacter sphaeroides WS8N]